MVDLIILPLSSERRRSGLFVAILLLVAIIMDGPPQVASPLAMQMILLPFTAAFLFVLFKLLHSDVSRWRDHPLDPLASSNNLLWLVLALELSFAVLFFYQTRHYAELGYRLHKLPTVLIFAVVLGTLTAAFKLGPRLKLVVFLGSYSLGIVLAILSFPLVYLRSDMLPVIEWAGRALLSGQNPYQHFYVADRIYDFPYLPGTLLAFAPTQALSLDPRWAGLIYLTAGMCLIYWATQPNARAKAVLLIGLFVMCPYLQYRHDLYTQAHFFSLIVVFVLMQRKHFGWAASAFGVSMLVSQFSWVIFPFFLLNALRRGRWFEVLRTAALSLFAVVVCLSPFMTSGAGTIAHNAVGQWDSLIHPIARPINLSFWASYLIRPVNLKWLQLALLSTMFGFCFLKDRCRDLEDTLRWMISALAVFIAFNVLVDGYFYLMLLIPLLVYTCVANGWWAEARLNSSRQAHPGTLAST